MALFGAAYALASLGCAIAPFLAIVVTSLQAGSTGQGLALFGAYALGMGLVVAVAALGVALLRDGLVARLRVAGAWCPASAAWCCCSPAATSPGTAGTSCGWPPAAATPCATR